MSTIKRLAIVASLWLGMLHLSAARASAQEYGAFSISNPTDNTTLYYRVRLGANSNWSVEYTLPPGTVRTHYFFLDGNGCAPPPCIRFNDSACCKVYNLEFYAVSDVSVEYGKTYHFAKRKCGRWDLYGDE